MGSRKRGADAVAAIRSTIDRLAPGITLDEHDEVVLAAIARAHNRAADLDRDAAKARGSGGSPRRVTELLAEARLQEAQAEKWSRDVIGAVEAQVRHLQKDWRAQKAANARWDRVGTGGR